MNSAFECRVVLVRTPILYKSLLNFCRGAEKNFTRSGTLSEHVAGKMIDRSDAAFGPRNSWTACGLSYVREVPRRAVNQLLSAGDYIKYRCSLPFDPSHSPVTLLLPSALQSRTYIVITPATGNTGEQA